MKNRWKMTAVSLCAVLAFGGCSAASGNHKEAETADTAQKDQVEKTQEDEETEEPEYQVNLDMIEPSAYNNVDGLTLEPGAYLSILGRSSEGAYWSKVQEGVEQAVEDLNQNLGYEGKDKIKVTYNAPSDSDNVDEQVNILDEELARYPEAVGISIADVSACGVQFDLAAENGIPVVAFDSGSDYQGLLATVLTDNDASAREAAARLTETMEETGEVIIISDDSRLKTDQIREASFRDEIQANHPGVTVTNTYYLDQMGDTEEEVSPAETILEANPGVKGIFATSADAVSLALEICEGMEQRPAVVGYDAEEEETEALADGDLDGLIVQNPFGMGYATVVAAVRAATNQGNEAVINTGYTWVSADNLEEEAIQKILY